MMRAWYYYRGKLVEVFGEHPYVVSSIAKGKVRVRYHDETETLAVQARSLHLCRQAVAAYIDCEGFPSKVAAEWPGRYIECFIQDWH